MTAADQIPLFEPTGQELASLAGKHAHSADVSLRMADTWELRGNPVMCEAFERRALSSIDASAVCADAFAFEVLAGLTQ